MSCCRLIYWLMWHGSQDIFAGMDFTLRQGMIGEDVCNLNQVSWWSTTPETKTMYQIPKLFDLVRKLSPNRFRSFWPHVCGSHLKGTPPVHRASRISPCWQGTRFGLQFGAGGMVGMVRSHELEVIVASQILDCHCISTFPWLPTMHCKLWQPAGAVLLRQVVTGHRWTTAHSTNVPPWTRNGHLHCWQGGQWFVVWRCNMRCWGKHRSLLFGKAGNWLKTKIKSFAGQFISLLIYFPYVWRIWLRLIHGNWYWVCSFWTTLDEKRYHFCCSS